MTRSVRSHSMGLALALGLWLVHPVLAQSPIDAALLSLPVGQTLACHVPTPDPSAPVPANLEPAMIAAKHLELLRSTASFGPQRPLDPAEQAKARALAAWLWARRCRKT